jgi:hypothetical protein
VGLQPFTWTRRSRTVSATRASSGASLAIKIDKEILDWVVTAFKESHADEMKYHLETTAAFKPQYKKPFDILSEKNRGYKRKKAIFSKKNDRFDIWLLG